MPARRKPTSPCLDARPFDSSIHPLRQPFDVASFRMQIRKHRRTKWSTVAYLLHHQEWKKLWKQPHHTSIKGDNLVCTFRFCLRARNQKGIVNLDTGKAYYVFKKPDGWIGGAPSSGKKGKVK